MKPADLQALAATTLEVLAQPMDLTSRQMVATTVQLLAAALTKAPLLAEPALLPIRTEHSITAYFDNDPPQDVVTRLDYSFSKSEFLRGSSTLEACVGSARLYAVEGGTRISFDGGNDAPPLQLADVERFIVALRTIAAQLHLARDAEADRDPGDEHDFDAWCWLRDSAFKRAQLGAPGLSHAKPGDPDFIPAFVRASTPAAA